MTAPKDRLQGWSTTSSPADLLRKNGFFSNKASLAQAKDNLAHSLETLSSMHESVVECAIDYGNLTPTEQANTKALFEKAGISFVTKRKSDMPLLRVEKSPGLEFTLEEKPGAKPQKILGPSSVLVTARKILGIDQRTQAYQAMKETAVGIEAPKPKGLKS